MTPAPNTPGTVLAQLLEQASQMATHDNNEAIKSYTQAIENWRQNNGNGPKPVPPKRKVIVVFDDSQMGMVPKVVDGTEPVCAELPDGLPTPPPTPNPGTIAVDLGAQIPGSSNTYYAGPRDTAPDGYIYAPLGPSGPRWRKRVIPGPFGNWSWYETLA